MARVTMTIQAEGKEVGQLLKLLQGAEEMGLVVFEVSTSEEPERADGRRELFLRELWRAIQEPAARALLAELARRPGGYPGVEVDDALNVGYRDRAGRLSSIKFGLNRLGAEKDQNPIRRQSGVNGETIYTMSQSDAEIIRRLAVEGGLNGF